MSSRLATNGVKQAQTYWIALSPIFDAMYCVERFSGSIGIPGTKPSSRIA